MLKGSTPTSFTPAPIVLSDSPWQSVYGVRKESVSDLLSQHTVSEHPYIEALWFIEVEKAAHKGSVILRKLPESAYLYALLARASFAFDGFKRALEHAEKAFLLFKDNYHPAYLLAQYAKASALIGLAQVQQADAALQMLLKLAVRDHLIRLQIMALEGRANLYLLTAQPKMAICYLQDALDRAKGLDDEHSVANCWYLMGWFALQSARWDQAKAYFKQGEVLAAALGDYWDLPYRTADVLFHLFQGDSQIAAQMLQKITYRLDTHFYCLQWQLDAQYAQIAVWGWQGDQAALQSYLAQSLGVDEHVHQLRQKVYHAAAALLVGCPFDLTVLEQLNNTVTQKGLMLLSVQTRLIQALSHQDLILLLQCVELCIPNQHYLDFLWLAPFAVPQLRILLQQEHITLTFEARRFIQHIVSLFSVESGRTEYPYELTAKEWQVLQLIGKGFRNQQIADQLCVSLATVKTHINHAYAKLHVENRTQALQKIGSPTP